MAVNMIQADTNYLSNTINDLNTGLKNLRNLIDEIYQEMKELDSMWDGPANAEFNVQFENDRQDFLSVCKEIQKYIEKVDYAKREYNNCESRVADIVNAIRV